MIHTFANILKQGGCHRFNSWIGGKSRFYATTHQLQNCLFCYCSKYNMPSYFHQEALTRRAAFFSRVKARLTGRAHDCFTCFSQLYFGSAKIVGRQASAKLFRHEVQ